MKLKPWTSALLAAGAVSFPAMVAAEEQSLPPLQTALSATTLSGYVDTSMQWNISGDGGVPAYAFGGPSKADGFNLNVVQLLLERPLSDKEWAAGYKVDLIFGPDANTLATTSSGSANSTSDFAIKQAYVALRAPIGNGLDFKLGVWDTIIGYEVFESYKDPNVTRSYGYTIEPTTHTGLLMSYAFCPTISASFGIANTFGPTIDGRSTPDKAEWFETYMGSFTLTAPESWGFLAGSAFTGGVITGYNPGVSADQVSWYAGATINTPVKGLKAGLAFDYAGLNAQTLTAGVPSYAEAVGVYLTYQATEKLSVNLRGERASSDQLNSSGQPILGSDIVYEITTTVQYDLWKNVVARLEFRWDHATEGEPYGGSASSPGGEDNSYILLADFVYKF